MLKYFIILAVVGLAVCYTDVDDSFDYDAVANNATALRYHLNCFINKGPCDNISEHYKSHIREAVLNGCKDCTASHKHKAHAFLRGLLKNYPEGYAEMRAFYDPDNTNFAAMEGEVDKY